MRQLLGVTASPGLARVATGWREVRPLIRRAVVEFGITSVPGPSVPGLG